MTAVAIQPPKLPKQLPVFNHRYATCDKCELKCQRDKELEVTSLVPAKWNGLMIVGEGPGQHEVIKGRPFVGASGQLLAALLDSYNIKLDECYISNATLCLPIRQTGGSQGQQKTLHERFPNAIHSCLPRLEAEIAAVRPRVILALGAAALIALTGYEEHKTKRVKFVCENCDEDRRVGPVIECSHKFEDVTCGKRYWADEVPAYCTKCDGSLKKYKPKRVKCPICKGLKTREEKYTVFKHDYKIREVAGAVIGPKKHTWSDFGVKYIVPTLHPAFLLRGEKAQFIAKAVQKHFRKAFTLLKEDKDWGFEYEVTSRGSTLLKYIYEATEKNDFISCDIETSAIHIDEVGEELELDARKVNLVTAIKCIGFASKSAGYALVVDTSKASPSLLEALKRVLTDKNVKKVFHHGNYDAPVIRKVWGFTVDGYVGDTLIQHHDLYPDESHKLAHVAFSFTYAPIWKPPRNLHGREAHANADDLHLYNGRDCQLTIECHADMHDRLQRKKLERVYEMDMELQQQALAMHYNGLPVSLESIEKIGHEAKAKHDEHLARMRDILGDREFNPNKTASLAKALYNDLGYKPTAWTKGKVIDGKRVPQASTSKEAIARLPESQFKSSLILCREGSYVLKNFFAIDENVSVNERNYKLTPAKSFFLWPDGRVHPLWKAFGTRTGRFASSPNWQNLPKWLRAAIVSGPGRLLVGADEDQLELRVMAALCGDVNLIERCLGADGNRKLEPECDPHSYVASIAFGEAFTELDLNDPNHDKLDPRCRCETCQRKALRDICKRVIYGLNYGAGDATVLDAIYNGGYDGPPISLQMIAIVRTAIFTAFPAVVVWRERMLREAHEKQAIFSPLLGRKRHFPLGDILPTEVFNFPIQSGGADIVNARGTIIFHGINKVDPTAKYIAQVHDAIYYEIDAKKDKQVCDYVTKTMTWETPLYKGGPSMIFSAKADSGTNWKSV